MHSHGFKLRKLYLGIILRINLIMQNSAIYNCYPCRFYSSNKTHYQRHLGTKKHQKNIEYDGETIMNVTQYCDCGKEFRHPSSFSRHKKKCRAFGKNEENQKTIKLQHENQKYLHKIIELQQDNLEKVYQQQNQNIELIRRTHQEQIENLKEIAIKSKGHTTNVQLNNPIIDNSKTIQFLNQHIPNMIDMDTFIKNYQNNYQLDENQTKVLLESYQLDGVKSYAKCLSKMLKDVCNQQLHDQNIQLPEQISFPLVTTDCNLRSVKIKSMNGWETTTDDSDLSRIIIISNDQVYRHHRSGIYLPSKDKQAVISYIKKDNPLTKVVKALELED